MSAEAEEMIRQIQKAVASMVPYFIESTFAKNGELLYMEGSLFEDNHPRILFPASMADSVREASLQIKGSKILRADDPDRARMRINF